MTEITRAGLPHSLSATQLRVLRELSRQPNAYGNLGGNGRGPILSAARALERKGLLRRPGCSTYVIREEYRHAAASHLNQWREDRGNTLPEPPK